MPVTEGVCQLMGSPTEVFEGGLESFIVRCLGALDSSHIDATTLGSTHASLHPCNLSKATLPVQPMSTQSLPPLQLQ